MTTALSVLAKELQNLEIPYEFMEWTGELVSTYWVGEYTEVASVAEDGGEETTIMLTGTTTGTWLELEQEREKIKRHFDPVHGLRTSVETGSVVIFYDNSHPVPTGVADLKRMQINLTVKEWRNVQ